MFYFDSFADFLAMGRHGVYVWTAYGIALAIMIGMVVIPVQRNKTLRKMIQRQLRRDAAAADREES